jgi:hypothetical protein
MVQRLGLVWVLPYSSLEVATYEWLRSRLFQSASRILFYRILYCPSGQSLASYDSSNFPGIVEYIEIIKKLLKGGSGIVFVKSP